MCESDGDMGDNGYGMDIWVEMEGRGGQGKLGWSGERLVYQDPKSSTAFFFAEFLQAAVYTQELLLSFYIQPSLIGICL